MAGGSHLSSVTQLLSVGAIFPAQNFAGVSSRWLCFPGTDGKGTIYGFPASFTDLVRGGHALLLAPGPPRVQGS